MKIILFIFSAFLLFLISTPALSQDGGIESQETYLVCNGIESTIKVSKGDLINTPSWNPEKDEFPPLSPRKAIEIGRINLKKCIAAGADEWFVRHLELNLIEKDKWFYEIVFVCRTDNCEFVNNRSFTFYVKMDGTIVEPKPKSKQNSEPPLISDKQQK